jgi:hypothetical protein
MPGLTAVRVFCLAPQKELTKTQDQPSHGNHLGFATRSGVKRTSAAHIGVVFAVGVKL